MRKCMIWILIVLLFLTACTPKVQDPKQEDQKSTDQTTNLQNVTQPHSPTEPPTEPTQSSDSQTLAKPWYTKINIADDFDAWQVRITEWNDVFYYITDDGLYCWDPVIEKEVCLITGDIRGLYVQNERFYYYTEFEIFQLFLDEENVSSRIWEHPDRYTDQSCMGICGLMGYGNWLYIKDSGISAIRYDLQSDQNETFLGDFSSLVFAEDTCYYIDHVDKTFSIYQLDELTRDTVIVRGDGVNKKYGQSQDYHYDELRAHYGNLYYYIRETGQYYRYAANGSDAQFREKAWILFSYIYPNLCYIVNTGDYIHIFEEDAFGNANLVFDVPNTEIETGSYLDYVLVTDSAVFYKSGSNAQVQFAWKYSGKDG